MNREQWLTDLAKQCEPLFNKFKILPYRVTCGWPCKGGISLKRRVIGECHHAKSSKSGIHEIFISPILDKPIEVAGTLCHELAHVAAGIEAAHGKGFVKVCKHVGLTKGRPTSVMPGDFLNERLEKVISKLGSDYPHQALVPIPKVKVKTVSVIKLTCPKCDCIVTIGRKWLEEAGLPTCGCGEELLRKKLMDRWQSGLMRQA